MKIIGIIPARYASTRFPGKPLIQINGKTMLQRVFEQASKALDTVIVATDDKRIETEVSRFGGISVLTSKNHQSGTDRCAEAIENYSAQINEKFDVIINIQGDEPFIEPKAITLLSDCFKDPKTQIATLINKENDINIITDKNNVKVIFNTNKEAIYFSRSIIPFIRNSELKDWTAHHQFYKHIGIYAYRNHILQEITKLPQTSLEIAESLEQNRWIENGFKIKVEITEYESISIDTKEDLDSVINFIR